MEKKRITRSKLILNLYLISLVVITSNTAPLLAKTVQNDLNRFNKTLELLENSFEANNLVELCNQSVEASKIISLNKKEFSLIEPNYNWDEIMGLIKKVSERFCTKKSN